MPGDLNINLPESSGEALQEAYQDTIKPIASPLSQTLGLIPRAIRAKLLPCEKWILNCEYELEETKRLLEHRLEKCQPEQIVSPEPYVAVPALQAISYSIDSKELRKMYANLLAKAMYEPTKDNVHPSFIEIIKQLSPIDADLFQMICEKVTTPIISLTINSIDFHKTFTPFAEHSFNDQLTGLNNLERLGLIQCNYSKCLKDEKEYDVIRKTSSYLNTKQEILSSIPDCRVEDRKGLIDILPLGEIFYTICINDSLEQSQ